MRIVFLPAAVFICLIATIVPGVPVRSGLADPIVAQDNWKNEFETVCSYTHNAASMSSDELKGLISRCDALRPRLEILTDPERRITLKRLRMCRELYSFVLESKENSSR